MLWCGNTNLWIGGNSLPFDQCNLPKYHYVLLNAMRKYVSFLLQLRILSKLVLDGTLSRLKALPTYYRLNDLMWQDGLLIDFLQKKVVDKWIRRFLVITSYLFSERVLFTFVVRFYTDTVIWPSNLFSIFEFSNISMTLNATLSTLAMLVAAFNLNYLYVLLF